MLSEADAVVTELVEHRRLQRIPEAGGLLFGRLWHAGRLCIGE